MTEDIQDDAAAAVRRPPQSVLAEQAILGGLMVDNTALDSVVDIIHPEDFYRRDHRLIYEEITRLIQKTGTADYLTVYESLKQQGTETEAGGLPYLTDLVNNSPSAANIRRYAEIVHDKSILRQLITVGDRIVSDALAPEGRETSQILDNAEKSVLAINERNQRSQRGFQPLATLVRNVSARVIELYNTMDSSEVTGVSSGYRNLDNVTAGLQPGDLIIIAGRPSMGKTSFALNIAENVGVDQGLPVAVFSMEMGADQLAQRMISSVGRIDAQKLRKGRLDDEDWDNFTAALHKLEEKPIYIDDTPGLTITELSSRTRRLVNMTGRLGLVVVDYLQLMSGQSRSSDNRAQELSEISRGLKSLAKELSVPVIALSQLNRSVDSRQDRRPVMSDLRESGAIEQDADVIMFIYRDVVYNKETPDKNLAEIIVAKQRNGPIGTLRMTFLGGNTRFEPSADEGYWGGIEE
ncbi:replicative DNA helicase [Sutterella sp.]|uniref:replicative DNA helicase n=1 Tax=Sutterella sp. TaxID=1981025 RepID=UPI0026DFCC46|nr:replicative DNA helicase [Sutterella sp.]MDO5531617.1 replicative DNA helicase [Sutterella sp.]